MGDHWRTRGWSLWEIISTNRLTLTRTAKCRRGPPRKIVTRVRKENSVTRKWQKSVFDYTVIFGSSGHYWTPHSTFSCWKLFDVSCECRVVPVKQFIFGGWWRQKSCPKTKLLASLYFVMTSLTSVGFGNIAANTKSEQESVWVKQFTKGVTSWLGQLELG